MGVVRQQSRSALASYGPLPKIFVLLDIFSRTEQVCVPRHIFNGIISNVSDIHRPVIKLFLTWFERQI